LHKEGFQFIQAPLCSSFIVGNSTTASYAEVLMRVGFLQPASLAGQLLAWRGIFEQVSPALVVMDSAPSATLALRDLPIPFFTVSHGFGAPADQCPWPAFAIAEKFSAQRIHSSEQSVLDCANASAAMAGMSALPNLGALYPAATTYITSIAQLDHYERKTDQYIGSTAMTTTGNNVPWPIQFGPQDTGELPAKIFVYLKSHYTGLDLIFSTLAAMPVQVIAYIPGISGANLKKWNSAAISVSTEPVNLQTVLTDCAALVCHGGGLVEPTLLAGVPILIFPTQVEQMIMAQKIDDLGAGLVCHSDALPTFKKKIKLLLSDAKYSVQAKAIAQQGKQFSATARLHSLVEKMIASIPS
jgi:hypothetical protein